MSPSDSLTAARARVARLRLVLLAAAVLAFVIVAIFLLLQGVRAGDDVSHVLADVAPVLYPAGAVFIFVTVANLLIFSYFVRRNLESFDRQNQRLAALQRIGHGLNATLDLDELLAMMLRETVAAGDALCGQFWLSDVNGDLQVAARHRVAGTAGASPWLAQQAAHSTRIATLQDVRGERNYVPMDALSVAAVAVPVLRNGSTIGVLQLEMARRGQPGDERAEALYELLNYAAVAINNARMFAALERQLAESAMLVEVARTVNASPNLIDVMQATTAMLANTLGYQRVAIYLREGDILFQAAQRGYEPARCQLRLTLQQGVVGRAARLAQTQFVENVAVDPDYVAAADDVRFEIALPLLREGEVVGVINVESGADQALSGEDSALLAHVGPQISVAIENARLHMDQAQRLRVMALLHENTLDLLAELDLSNLLHTLVERAARLSNAATAVLYLYRPETRVLDVGAAYNLPVHVMPAHVPLGEDVPGQVARTGRSLVVENYDQWPGKSAAFAEAGFAACVGVPMHSRGAVIGVIAVANVRPAARFAPETIQLLELFANQAAAAIINAELYLAEQQRRRTSDALREVGRVVSSSLDLEEVLALILQQLERVLPYDSATIMLWDERVLLIKACRGFESPELVVGNTYATDDGGVLLEALQSRQPTVIGDVRDEPRWPRRKTDTDELRDVRAWIGVPMVAQDRTVGLMTVDSHEPNFYRQEDGLISQAFAEQAAMAIHNARLYAETQAKLAELKVLYDVALAASSAESVADILERAILRLREDLGISHALILLVEADQQWLRIGAAGGFPPEHHATERMAMGEGIIGHVAQTGRPMLVPDVRREPRYLEDDPDVRSELCVPLAIGSQVIGVLDVQSSKPAAFGETDQRLLSTMAGQLAALVSNAQLVDVLVASQQQLAERNRALQEANLRLQELDRMKSQFLANMSHELRTPLNSIIGFAEVLVDGLAGALNDEQSEYVGYIHGSGQHLLSLINDVLDLSKIDAGKMKLDVRPFNLNDLLPQLQTTFAPMVQRRRQNFVIDLAPDLPMLNGDAFRIKQVLLNLLSNALKYTPDGGQITLAARLRDADTVLLSVTDTGPGIKPEYHQVIFEEFRQADSGLTREFEGTGLGLTICRRLVELHGGQIWVESEYGHGATFCFVLPVVGPGGIARRGNLPNRTALIVEDDQQFSQLLSLYMRQAGYEPAVVHTGSDALPSAHRLRPAFITLDVMLPELNGWTVLQALKTDEELRDIPVLIISVIEDAERALSLGAVDYLVKPLDRNALLAVIKRLQIAETRAARPLTVLLVDDDPAMGELIAGMLPREEFAVRQALSAEQALDCFEDEVPQLVILDFLLHNGDGPHVLETLRTRDSLSDVPVIMLSENALDETRRAELSDRIRAFMSKTTFTRDQLLAEVRRLEKFHREKAHGSV